MAAEVLASSAEEAHAAIWAILEQQNALAVKPPIRLVLGPVHLVEPWREAAPEGTQSPPA